MNVYLDNAGLIKNCRHMHKVSKILPTTEQIDLFLTSNKRITLIEQMLMLVVVPKIKTIQLTIEISSVLPQLIWFANVSPRFSVQFVANRPIGKRKWHWVSKLKDIIYIQDQSGVNHGPLFESHKRVLYCNGTCNTINLAESYFVAAKMPIKRCKYSSCLGKTLYIAPNGVVSYCPEAPEQTSLGPLYELGELFNAQNFIHSLTAMIAKRNSCKRSCSHYSVCMGGCVFQSDCTSFKEKYDQAENELHDLIDSRCDLSSLPFYKEYAIIYKLFSLKIKYTPREKLQ